MHKAPLPGMAGEGGLVYLGLTVSLATDTDDRPADEAGQQSSNRADNETDIKRFHMYPYR